MKKLLVLGLILLFAGIASAAVEPTVTIESISPQPSEPGDTVNLHVVLGNDGDTDATFDPVDVETVEGVSVIGSTDVFSSSFSLCGGCQTVGTVRLAVDADTVSGIYPVDVALRRESGGGVIRTAELEVDGTPNLIVSSSRITAVPGENVTADITVKNIGTDTASQTVLELTGAGFSMQPSSLDLGRIAPGESVTRQVTLNVDRETASGITRLNMDVDYRDESDGLTESRSITVDVQEQAEVVVSDVNADGAAVGKESSITVTLENLGPGEAERIAAELSCDDTAEVVSGRAFVGQLDDEENVPATFTLTPRTRSVACDLSIDYSDAETNTVTESVTFAAAKTGTSPLLIAAAVIVLAIAGFYVNRKRKQDELAAI